MNTKTKSILAALALLIASIFGTTTYLGGTSVGSATTSTLVVAGTSNTQLLPGNGNRNSAHFSIPSGSTSTLWVACGFNATSGQGIAITSSSPRFSTADWLVQPKCAWNGISDNAAIPTGVEEF